jgi:hypothetical protein
LFTGYFQKEKALKRYILKEYGSWGVMTLSYLTGLIVSGGATPEAVAVFIAISLYINSKQAFVLWMRHRGKNPPLALAVFAAQVLSATILLFIVMGSSLVSLLPYSLVPLTYLACLWVLGEHSILTEISGFVLLSLSALVAKMTTTGVIDPELFVATAIFFSAAVFKVRIQFKKGMLQRLLMIMYIGFALVVYRLMHVSMLLLLPLADNLFFSITLYRAKLGATGWLEMAKGIVFLLLMALSYH